MDSQHVGVPYRQLSARLRVQRGPGRPDLVSERPRATRRDGSAGRYLDSDESPTLITFDEYCQADVPALLRSGALMEYAPPAAPIAPEPEPNGAGEGDARG